jgi:hypothetical protein
MARKSPGLDSVLSNGQLNGLNLLEGDDGLSNDSDEISLRSPKDFHHS